jgi:hypothetical protein
MMVWFMSNSAVSRKFLLPKCVHTRGPEGGRVECVPLQVRGPNFAGSTMTSHANVLHHYMTALMLVGVHVPWQAHIPPTPSITIQYGTASTGCVIARTQRNHDAHTRPQCTSVMGAGNHHWRHGIRPWMCPTPPASPHHTIPYRLPGTDTAANHPGQCR